MIVHFVLRLEFRTFMPILKVKSLIGVFCLFSPLPFSPFRFLSLQIQFCNIAMNTLNWESMCVYECVFCACSKDLRNLKFNQSISFLLCSFSITPSFPSHQVTSIYHSYCHFHNKQALVGGRWRVCHDVIGRRVRCRSCFCCCWRWWGSEIEFRPSIKIAEASSQAYQATIAQYILINETNRFFFVYF